MTTTDLAQSEIIAEDLPMHDGQLEQYQHLGLSRRDAFALEGHAARIISRQRRAILEIGRELCAARELAQLGAWGPFLQRVGLEERTAQNYMNVFKRFGETPEIISALPPTALYRLAAPGADQTVVAEIVDEVQQGARPSIADVQTRLAPPPARPAPAPAPALPAPRPSAAPATREADEEEEIAAPPPPAPALPAPALPPALTPLPAAIGAGMGSELRKLLAAKRALLDAALELVERELEQTPGQVVVIHHERALEAARLFLVSPAFGGAAAMLAFSAVEGAAA